MRVSIRRSFRRRVQILFSLLLIGASARGEIAYQQVQSLGFLGADGVNPQARLLVGADGTLYGTTYLGGSRGQGTIFAMNLDGSNFRFLREFEGGTDGAQPYAELVFGWDGAIYGTSEEGGINNGGTIFKIHPGGTGYQVLYRFASTNGYWPRGHMLEGSDGYFYSTTQFGGSGGSGTVYKIRPDGTGFAVLHAFGTQPMDGRDCDGGLMLASDGMLYGVTSGGGISGAGTLYTLRPDGSNYEIMHHFDGTNGGEPDGELIELPDGALYGTTQFSETTASGSTIYKINKDGSGFEVLRFLRSANGDPSGFLSGLTLGLDGALYGSLLRGIIKIQPDGSGFEVLHRFALPSVGDGFAGFGLTIGTDGALYGATQFGGAYGPGTIFRINPDGSDYSILHHFQRQPFAPMLPRASLVPTSSGTFFGTSEGGGATNAGTIFSLRANGSNARLVFSFGIGTNAAKVPNRLCDGGDGFLYGTTSQGGASNVGTIFRIENDGSNYSILRHLGEPTEPRSVRAGLILGSDGWLYGTSPSGGTSSRGTVYKVDRTTGTLVVLRRFSAADGFQPQCELVQGPAGLLYGTASFGGAHSLGVVFRIAPDGSTYEVLHSFAGGLEGQNPSSGVMMASDGWLYGTTARQTPSVAGSIYKLETDGSEFQVLRTFTNTGLDPKLPRPVLVEGSDGFLYGSTQLGGAYNKGTLFRIRRDGSAFAVLHEFGRAGDGQTPSAAFTAVGDGSFLGVTEAGGAIGNGSIFRFDGTEVRLRIGLTATTANLRWPASSTADNVETASGESGFDWRPTAVVVAKETQENRATIPRASSMEFYRVQRVWP